jgi:hypothetical protein
LVKSATVLPRMIPKPAMRTAAIASLLILIALPDGPPHLHALLPREALQPEVVKLRPVNNVPGAAVGAG